MDIPALSMAMSQADIGLKASVSVLKMTMDNMEQSGQQIAELIEGCTVDIKV